MKTSKAQLKSIPSHAHKKRTHTRKKRIPSSRFREHAHFDPLLFSTSWRFLPARPLLAHKSSNDLRKPSTEASQHNFLVCGRVAGCNPPRPLCKVAVVVDEARGEALLGVGHGSLAVGKTSSSSVTDVAHAGLCYGSRGWWFESLKMVSRMFATNKFIEGILTLES